MEDHCSIGSPRRILSLSKRRASVSFPDSDEKASAFGVSGERGPKPSEVYGFVGAITTVVATVVYMGWAYVPEHWLHSVGIYYYPSRYWAIAVPTYAMVTVVLAIGYYIGLSFMVTSPPTSFTTMFGEALNSYKSFLICIMCIIRIIVRLLEWFDKPANGLFTLLGAYPLSTLLLLADEYSREYVRLVPSADEEDELPIQPMSDVGITKINEFMFEDLK